MPSPCTSTSALLQMKLGSRASRKFVMSDHKEGMHFSACRHRLIVPTLPERLVCARNTRTHVYTHAPVRTRRQTRALAQMQLRSHPLQ